MRREILCVYTKVTEKGIIPLMSIVIVPLNDWSVDVNKFLNQSSHTESCCVPVDWLVE